MFFEPSDGSQGLSTVAPHAEREGIRLSDPNNPTLYYSLMFDSCEGYLEITRELKRRVSDELNAGWVGGGSRRGNSELDILTKNGWHFSFVPNVYNQGGERMAVEARREQRIKEFEGCLVRTGLRWSSFDLGGILDAVAE